MDNFCGILIAENIPVPKNGIALNITPNEGGTFNISLYGNFENPPNKLTERDKVLFLIGQGILEIVSTSPDLPLERGLATMENFVKKLIGEPEVDLATLDVKGSA